MPIHFGMSDHRPRPRSIGFSLLLALALALPAEARIVRGMPLPDELPVAGKTLRLNGAAVQRKLVFDLYTIALYLEHPTRDARQVIESNQVKQLRLRMLHDATREQVAGALRGRLQAAKRDVDSLQPRLERLLGALPQVSKGDELVITYHPATGTILESKSGTQLTLPGKDLADALFSIWLGEGAAMDIVRAGLLGG